MHYILIILAISFSMNTLANDKWVDISPLDFCPKYKISFNKLDNGFEVKIPDLKNDKIITKQILDINNLSILTDTIIESSALECSNDLELISFDSQSIQYQDRNKHNRWNENIMCSVPYRFNEEFLTLTKDVISIIQDLNNTQKCEQIADYLELQSKIEQLKDKDLIEVDKSRHPLHRVIKLFVDEPSQDMIDLFNACGRRINSDKFIANSIMLEVSNSCLYPKPPGMMSFKDAKNIADSIGSQYQKQSLVRLYRNTDEIVQKSALGFVDAILKNEVNELIGPYITNTDEFIYNLDAHKKLRKKKIDENYLDYISYGFSVDALVEIADKSIGILLENSIKDKLPDDWDEKTRRKFLDDKILPQARNKYQACMKPYLEKVYYNEKDYFNKRLELKNKYCNEYPESCPKNDSCNRNINLMSNNPEQNDTQIVQGCVMDSIFKSINPFLEALIAEQKDAFADSFNLTDSMVNELTNKTWNVLTQCTTEKVLEENNLSKEKYQSDAILHDRRLLEITKPENFQNIVTLCANKAEKSVTKDFITKLLINNDSFSSAFTSEKRKERFNNKYNKEMLKSIDEILDNTFEPCIARQEEIIGTDLSDDAFKKINPLYCTPQIEMNASKIVILKNLKDTFIESQIDESTQAKTLLVQFENCSDEAIHKAKNSIGKPRVSNEYSIINEEDANLYLKKNHDFYQCVENAITKSASLITEATLDSMSEELKESLRNPNNLARFRNESSNLVSACFKENLNKEAGSWPKFIEFNERNGLDQIKKECEQRVTDFVLPKVMIREAGSLLNELRDEGIIKNQTEVGNILALSAVELRRSYQIELPSDLKGDDIVEYSFAKAHSEHLKRSPSNTTDTFIKEFTDVVLRRSVNNIHAHIKNETKNVLRPVPVDDLFDSLSPQCIVKIYNKFDDDITNFIDEMNKKPKDEKSPKLIETITGELKRSILYAKERGEGYYKQTMTNLKQACKEIDKFKTIQELADTGAIDFIIEANIRDQVVESFEEAATNQCKNDVLDLLPKTDENTLNQVCRITTWRNLAITKQDQLNFYAVQGTANTIKLRFIFERMNEFSNLIDNELRDANRFHSNVIEDSNVLKNIYDNFTAVMSDDEDVSLKINNLITERLFKDKSLNSFADKFTKLQVINGVGVSGYDNARALINPKSINESVSWWQDIAIDKDKVFKNSRTKLDLIWNPGHMKNIFSWDKIDKETREELINTVYENSVMTIPENEQEKRFEQLNERIHKHVSEYKYKDKDEGHETIASSIETTISDSQIKNWHRNLGIEFRTRFIIKRLIFGF